MNKDKEFYSVNAASLASSYDSIPCTSVHKDWLSLLPNTGNVLDIGAGSGRDSFYLANHGLQVIAVEPGAEMMAIAKRKLDPVNVVTIADSLPYLEKIRSLKTQFDLILVSAVWMHLSPKQQILSLEYLAPLLTDSGILVITLRHGAFDDGRTAHPTDANDTVSQAAKTGLCVSLLTARTEDKLGRDNVQWQTVVFKK